jgi:mannose-6-phosphate isomerase-like protein (cupin superfamily)
VQSPILREVIMRKYALVVAALCCAGAAFAQTGRSPSVSLPNSLKWGPAPSILPAGARLAVLDGDPTKSGAFTMRLMMPPGYRIPPHFHHADEHVTVISGALNVGMGDKFTTKGGIALSSGSFGMIPEGVHHFAWTRGRTIIQLHGQGPWGLEYVNAADAPRSR